MTTHDRPAAADVGGASVMASIALVTSIGLGTVLAWPDASPASAAPTTATASTEASRKAGPSRLHSATPALLDTRYYVVGKPVNGQKEFLFAIAANTLGDGRRQNEIFELNRGRPQPDGRQMTDPLTIEPGWILLLPPDAHGNGVVIGPLPEIRPPTSASARPPSSGTIGFLISRTGAFVITALLFIAFLARRRHRKAARERRRLDTPGHDQFAAVIAEGPPTRRTTATAMASSVVRTADVAGAAIGPMDRVTSDVRLDAVRRGERHGVESRLDPSGPALALAEPRRQIGRPSVHRLRTELRCGDDVATVRLTGVRTTTDSSAAHRWLTPDQSPPTATAPIVLGHGLDGRLWVDLALAPDVLTINGHPDARRRQAIALIGQLGRAGTPVTVVGETLRPWLPAGCHQVDTLSQLDPSTRNTNEAEVVVCAGGTDHTLAAVHTLLQRTDRRLIPIVVGDVPSSRWSVRMALGERGQTTADDD